MESGVRIVLQRIFKQISRSLSVLLSNGPGEFFGKVVRKLRTAIGFPSEDYKRYLAYKADVDSKFDDQLGLDTGGIQRLHDLTIASGNSRFGTSHIASDPAEFAAALGSVDIPIPGTTFIDLGSGKGRALILALDFGFARIVGIEFARELYEIAQANVARLTSQDDRATRIEVFCDDATTVDLPPEPTIFYLFHPFDSSVMRLVARNARASWQANPRPMRVVYVNPQYLQDWTDAGWEIVAQEHYHVVLKPV
ncbi:class I SAM-dependent methyltransferase [Sphingomonas sp. GB1N7]|uniref:class I SAM-dependent methyltransferase n=1 Tax=Parasphingomonas caseinilytica TaxID=3096158 RepID=UPI002FC8E6F9